MERVVRARKRIGWTAIAARWASLVVTLVLGGCTHLAIDREEWTPRNAWLPAQESVGAEHARFAPALVHERDSRPWNRPGTPRASRDEHGRVVVRIDPAEAAMFTERRRFRGERGEYTNHLYRVHFERVPFRLVPFHLTAGRNGGLFVIVTVDERDRPLLVTTVHTCGCYRAFVPTRYLAEDAYPPGWPRDVQTVFGERLPARIEWNAADSGQQLVVRLRPGTHRVMDVAVMDEADLEAAFDIEPLRLRPLADLERLPLDDGTVSMFHDSGLRQDLVRGSFKPFELVLMSWWALDPAVGVDRRLGRPGDGGRVFYTSLKPWAREASDMRDFAGFLRYWGWQL